MTTVIILAAGTSPYHEQNFGDAPQSLVKIGNETVLGRQIRLFKKKGITDVVVVVAYQKEKIMEAFPKLNYVPSRYWDETKVEKYGPEGGLVCQCYSLMLTKPLWKDDVLVISGDIVFTEEALTEVLETPLHASGFAFFGSKQHPIEIFCVHINKNGVDYLKSLKEPFPTVRNEPSRPLYYYGKPLLFRWAQFLHLLWHLQISFKDIDRIVVSGFILDIDGTKDVETCRQWGII